MREIPMSPACRTALAAIETDPLDPGVDAEAHMRSCTACSEARVAYLAQEEVPLALAPAGYFERLPGRIQGKLPARSRPIHTQRFFWGTAAALLLAVGGTAFWVGRANRTPLVEANLSRPAVELQDDDLTDTPFQDGEDALSQLTALSQEDAEAVIRALSRRPKPSPSEK